MIPERLSLLALLLAASATLASPGEAVAAAHADCAKQPAGIQPYLRYLSLYAVKEKDRPDAVRAVSFWLNSLSREVEIVQPAIVGNLIRLNLYDYRMSEATWEKFSQIDPYFHTQIEREEEVAYETTVYKGNRWYRVPGGEWTLEENWKRGKTFKRKIAGAAAPWLPTKEIAALITATQSQAPILRADWWLVQTSRQVDLRNRQTGVGYYDWLGVKDRNDFEKLVKFNKKDSVEIGRDKRMALDLSGVSQQNRRVTRFQSLTGGYWITFDVKDSTDKGNALRILDDKNFKHDAEEIYGVLPNGLFAYFLCDDRGTRQDTAPDFIGPDDSPLRIGRDARIHVGISCTRCHVEGLRPVNDWVRRTYQGPVQLTSPDYKVFQELRRQYLSEIDVTMGRDRQVFADSIRLANGLDAAKNAKAIALLYNWYVDDLLTLDRIALEMGCKPADVTETFKKMAASGLHNLDPLLVSVLSPNFRSIRRDHWEEVYGLAQLAIRGITP